MRILSPPCAPIVRSLKSQHCQMHRRATSPSGCLCRRPSSCTLEKRSWIGCRTFASGSRGASSTRGRLPLCSVVGSKCHLACPPQLRQGFDWATSGNSYPEDAQAWEHMSPLMERWVAAMRKQDGTAAEACIDEMTPLLTGTSWFSSFRGKVQGALQSAAQDSPSGTCVAVCIQGGCVRAQCFSHVVFGVVMAVI